METQVLIFALILAVNEAFAEFVPDETIFYGTEIDTPMSSAMSPAIGTQSEPARIFTKAPPPGNRAWRDSVPLSPHLASPSSSSAAKGQSAHQLNQHGRHIPNITVPSFEG